jgi:putative transposase
LACSVDDLRQLIESNHEELSLRRQCQLLGLARSSFYYEAQPESEADLLLMRMLDEQYTRTPFYGIRRMTAWVQQQGQKANHKHVRRLLRLMGLEAIYPKPRLSQAAAGHRIYPYLLRGVRIERVNQVWSSDITYIRLTGGFVYLVAIIDWFSRYVLAWELSVTLDSDFCISALERALEGGQPEVFNTDQGAQFTSLAFTAKLLAREVRISMDGRGRALDNIFVERLWRTVKYEDIYLNDYVSVPEVQGGLGRYFRFYNGERLHQSRVLLAKRLTQCSAGAREALKEAEAPRLARSVATPG